MPKQIGAQLRPRGSNAVPEWHERVSSRIEQRRPSYRETEYHIGIQLQNVLGLREVVRPQIGPLPNVFPQAPRSALCRPVAHLLRNANLMDLQLRILWQEWLDGIGLVYRHDQVDVGHALQEGLHRGEQKRQKLAIR